MAADLHTQMRELSLAAKGIFNLTKGLNYTPVTVDAIITACSNAATKHAAEAEDIALALMMKMQEQYPEGGDIDPMNLISGYNRDGNKFLVTFPNAAYSRAALAISALTTTTANGVTYTITLDEHVQIATSGATHSDSFMWGICKIRGGEHLTTIELAGVLMRKSCFPAAGLKLSETMRDHGINTLKSETGMTRAGSYNVSGLEPSDSAYVPDERQFPAVMLNIKHGNLTIDFHPCKPWCAYLGICHDCLKNANCVCKDKGKGVMADAQRSLAAKKKHDHEQALARKMAKIKGSATAPRGAPSSSEA